METSFFTGISLDDTTMNSCQAIPGPNVMFLIRPRGIWLRTVAPKSMSGRGMSSTYWDRPVTLSRPSLRGTDLPTMGSEFMRQMARKHSDVSRPSRADGMRGWDSVGQTRAQWKGSVAGVREKKHMTRS